MGLQFGFGSGILYGMRTDIPNATPRRFGVLQDVSIDWNGEIKELFGQLQYPLDVARGKTKIEGKAKFAQISGPEFNDLFFGQTIQSGGQKLPAFNETQSVPAVNTQTALTTGSIAIGSTTLPLVSAANISVGQQVTGNTSIPANTYVTSVNTTTNVVGISNATVTAAITTGSLITFSGLSYQAAAAALTGATSLVLNSVQGLYAGMTVNGSSVAASTTITVNAATNTITLSAALTGAVALNSILLFGPLILTTATPANTLGSPLLTFTSTTGAALGQLVGTGVPGIPPGTTIAALTGTTITMSANSTAAIAIGTAIPITPLPAITPNFGGVGVFDQDFGPIYGATGFGSTYTASPQPTVAGTYYVNPTTGQYIFSVYDGGAQILLNYTYVSALTGFKITGTNLQMGSTPRFLCEFNQTYNGNNLVLKLFQCVSSKLTMPTKIDDYVINEIDFMAFANAAGNVFELSVSS